MSKFRFVPKDRIDNKSALVQVMAWRQTTITWTNADAAHRRKYAALMGGWVLIIPSEDGGINGKIPWNLFTFDRCPCS